MNGSQTYARKIYLTGTYYILKHSEYARLEDEDADQHLTYRQL